MNENVAKLYKEIEAKVKTSEVEYQSLVKKLDEMEAGTPSFRSKVEVCENEEKQVYDAYFLGKATEKDLTGIRQKIKNAKESLTSHSKMLESLNRCITGKEKEIAALHKQSNTLRHQTWQSVFEKKVAEIPEPIKVVVKELVAIGLQCSMHRNYILEKIFPLPTNSEIQKIYKEQTTKHGID